MFNIMENEKTGSDAMWVIFWVGAALASVESGEWRVDGK
jgi:hypothetical protein